MTNRTTTMIALGLILAMGSVPPAEAGKQFECSEDDDGDDGGGGGIQLSTDSLLDTTFTADLAKPVRDCLGEPCDEGTVGLAGVCIQEPDVRLDPCPADTIGTAGVCIDQPQEKECDEGQISLLFACMNEYGLPPLPETAYCPAPSKGLIVDGKAYCVTADPKDPVPGDDGQDPPPGAECQRDGNDNGFGGTHVRCDYACRTGDELGIYVEAHDDDWGDAEADGYTRCGGTEAHCDQHPVDENQCAGASVKPVTYDEYEAVCHGESHEAFDSKVTVACYVLGPCLVLDIVCEHTGLSMASITAICLQAAHPGVPDQELRVFLASLPFGQVRSLVAFHVDQGEGLAVAFDSGSALPCTVTPIGL